jgi:hypothetical protein
MRLGLHGVWAAGVGGGEHQGQNLLRRRESEFLGDEPAEGSADHMGTTLPGGVEHGGGIGGHQLDRVEPGRNAGAADSPVVEPDRPVTPRQHGTSRNHVSEGEPSPKISSSTGEPVPSASASRERAALKIELWLSGLVRRWIWSLVRAQPHGAPGRGDIDRHVGPGCGHGEPAAGDAELSTSTLEWRSAGADLLCRAAPWRTFRWHKGWGLLIRSLVALDHEAPDPSTVVN